MSTPRFAVVGHPNKGKSSIVSTLANDEQVMISALSGTTREVQEYPLMVDDETLYVLIDTPGFQRPRAALEWMHAQAGSSAERPQVVRRFVEQHQGDARFEAECRLLAPLIGGAGILYVVDGSRPFGHEYEAEMEILRWTGQPSLALINMIGSGDYRHEWENALGQYFRIVRVFNAMKADFDKRLQLLLAFAQLCEAWRAPLERAVQVLRAERQRRRTGAVRLIAECLAGMITYFRESPLDSSKSIDRQRAALGEAYRAALTRREQACRQAVESLYDYNRLQRREAVVDILDEDLFSSLSWRLFGLTRRQLVATGGVGGAAAGSVIDVAVGGHSLLLGSGLGALIGGASAWFSADRIADIQLLGKSLGGQVLRIGPMRNINFPYVVLGRALLHLRMLEGRTHACREPLELVSAADSLRTAGHRQRAGVEKVFAALRKQGAGDPALLDRLGHAIEPLLDGGDEPEA